MDFDTWLLSGTEAGYFDTTLAPQLNGKMIIAAQARQASWGMLTLFSFSFLFDRPAVDCGAVLAYYSGLMSWPDLFTVEQVLTVVADIIRRKVRQSDLFLFSGLCRLALAVGSPATSALASRRLITRG